MTTIYQIDGYFTWTGVAREIGAREGCPVGWTRLPVPTLAEHEHAVLLSGGWAVTSIKPGPTLADLKVACGRAVEERYGVQILNGFTYDFGTIPAKLPDGTFVDAGFQVFQMRDLEDKTNWQLALTKANEAIAAGGSGSLVELRMLSNAKVQTTAAQAKAALLALLAWGDANLSNAWALKDQIVSAIDAEAALAVDIDSGWS